MSTWAMLITFFLTLPLAVWQLAAFLSIIDRRGHPAALLRAAAGVLVVLVITAFLAREFLWIFSAALILVSVLHVVYFYLFRHLLLGVDVTHREPLRARADLPSSDEEDDPVSIINEAR